ncbi:MAG: Gfo/Idh/MocA family oxidoreductase [Polyangiaceae bacterium]|nr:Gfo/Idh/MocA family oxidoreductase [Polyangiaceae bacterium]
MESSRTLALPASPAPNAPRSDTPLRVAVIGAGRWGRNLLRAFASAHHCELLTACDLEPSLLSHLPPQVRREQCAEAVLADERVDAVAIATPPASHAALTLAALRAGKHVFVEKPMAMSLPDALAIRAMSSATSRRVMVGLILHHHTAVQALERLVRTGALGSIQHIEAERASARGGCALHPVWWSLGPHDISLAMSLACARVDRIAASRISDGDRESITARFQTGDTTQVDLRASSRASGRRMTVHGSLGTAVFESERSEPLVLYERGGGAGHVIHCDRAPTEPLLAQVQHFVGRVRDGGPFAIALDHAIDVVAVLEAGQKSFQNGMEPVAVSQWRATADRHY